MSSRQAQHTSIKFNQYHHIPPVTLSSMNGGTQLLQQQHHYNTNFTSSPYLNGVMITKRKRRVLLDEEAEKIIKEEEREEFVRVLHDQYSKVDVTQIGTLPEAKDDPAVHLPTDDSWEYWMSVMLQYQSFRSFPMYTEDEEQQQKQLEWQREMRFQLMQKKRAIKREKRRMFKLKTAWVNKRKGEEQEDRPSKRTKADSLVQKNETSYTEAGNEDFADYEEGDMGYYMEGDDSLFDDEESYDGAEEMSMREYESAHYMHPSFGEHNGSGYVSVHHHQQPPPPIGFYNQNVPQHIPHSQSQPTYPSNQPFHSHHQAHHVVPPPPAGYYQPM